MLIVLSCINTECAEEDMFKVNDYGTKEFKNRSGIPTVSFSQQKLNVNIDAYLHEDNYYVRDNKNHKIYVYILDTDTGKIKGYNLFELTQLVINNVNITNIYRVSQYVYSINFLNLQRQISVSTDPTRIILIQYIMKKQDLTSFFLKSSLIPHCFYIVKLENVNGNSDFVFDFDVVKKDFETLKNSLDYLYNSLYTLAFYKNNGDFVYRVTVDFLTMLIL